jgi:hypothetical protein
MTVIEQGADQLNKIVLNQHLLFRALLFPLKNG